ncbi:MAG: proline dehydrogenase family protein [Planctomycetota bacterium]
MSEFPGQSDRLNRRAREWGHEIFELADAARPALWQKAWWLEGMTRLLDADPRLQTRAFEFVDCLPALKGDRAIVDHLSQYIDPRSVDLPVLAKALLAPGAARSMAGGMIAWGTRFGAAQMASRFITGYDVPSVVKTIKRLRRDGLAFTIDVLGEFTTSNAQADRYAGVYRDLIEEVPSLVASWPVVAAVDNDGRGPMPRANFSIKLSSLDPHFDAINPDGSIDRVGARLRPILRLAMKRGAFVNIDLESVKYRDITLALFKRILMEDEFRSFSDVGIVIQAYLNDGERDLRDLLDWGRARGTRFAIRLVKGAYWDAETAAAVRAYKDPPVWTQKWQSDASYENLTGILLDHVDMVRPCFASHNVRSLALVLAAAESRGIGARQYEIQMLFGMGDPLKTAMQQLGQCVRVYCPYGDMMPGMGYLIRRLLENTSNDGFLKQGFRDRFVYDRLLSDPCRIKPPSAPLPERHYRNTDPKEQPLMFQNASNTNFALAENREKMMGALEYVRGDFGRVYSAHTGDDVQDVTEFYESRNPSNQDEIVGRIALSTVEMADAAVEEARRAFDEWRTTTAAHRAQTLRDAADRFEKRRFELAATMVLEVGKPWREADADVTEGIDHCRFYAEQIERIEARPRIRDIPGENNKLVYSPKGVCAVISPWSFPLAILSGMTSAALAAGNTVVIKPAPQASVLAAKFVEILRQAGLPAGVASFLPGRGAVVGRHLVTHRDVKLVAFTGSHETGRDVIAAGSHQAPGQGFIRKLIVEMGGKNAIIVDDDADLDGAIAAVMESSFSYAGQKCSSCSRVIVLDAIYDDVLTRLKEAAQSLVIGPAEDPATIVGPVIDERAHQRLASVIEQGRKEAATLVQVPPPAGLPGAYVAPTIFCDVNPDSRLAQEEVFGPMLCVIRAKSFDHALNIANNSRYALTGGLYSRNPERIRLAQRDFAVGNLYINRKITGSQVDAQPFGGFKLSGTGVKAGSPDYLMHYMDARCITENTQRSGLVPDDDETDAELGVRHRQETDNR